MGMYTELVFKATVKPDAPAEVREILLFLFEDHFAGWDNDGSPLPDHRFFRCQRWGQIGSGSSWYHVPDAQSYVNTRHSDWIIFSRSDLKNYDGEIQAFIDWVSPYVEGCCGGRADCLGWMWYEENETPTLLYRKEIKKGA